MIAILSDLREGDYFNLITFSDKVHTWKKGRTVRATRQNVRGAKEFVRKIIAEGCRCFFYILKVFLLFKIITLFAEFCF